MKVGEVQVFGWVSGLFGKDIGIDLGTANIVVYVKGKGVVIDEPSVIAYRKPNRRSAREIIAYGSEAKTMAGKTPVGVETVRPLHSGVIADFEMTGALIRHFLAKANNGIRPFGHPRVIVCAPVEVTEVERKAFIDATLDGGAREAYVVEEPVAAAFGVGLPIDEPRGNMILDIGGGTSEIAVLSLSGVVVSNSLRVAGDEMDNAIIGMMRQNYTLSIGSATAEEVKNTIGSAYRLSGEKEIEVRGRNLKDGLPRAIRISSAEVREALNPVISQIVEMVRETMERTPPELARDIADQGLVLSGGAALLEGLDRRLSEELNVPVLRAERPLYSVADGIGKLLEQFDSMKKILVSAGHGVR
ncbi:MAG TPA: rod shape-determining protein [Synergistales bacterium]|nr:rod shape-determining protein [Synergistales bacterium]